MRSFAICTIPYYRQVTESNRMVREQKQRCRPIYVSAKNRKLVRTEKGGEGLEKLDDRKWSGLNGSNIDFAPTFKQINNVTE